MDNNAANAFQLTDKDHPPHSSEVEQALIGLLMLNNDRFDDIETSLRPEHFYVKFHGALYETIGQLLHKGFEASPITIRENLKSHYDGDVNLAEHLAAIIENASQAFRVKDLADIIHSYYLQRQLIDVGRDLAADATDIPPAEQEARIESLLNETEHKLFMLGEKGTSQTYQDLKNPLKAVIEQIEDARKNQGKLVGITTGFTAMDQKLGGLHKSDLVIVAARPSMGKTAFSVNIAQNAAAALMNSKHGGAAVGIFSMEMSAEQLTVRIMSAEARVNSHHLGDGSLSEDDFQKVVACANTLGEMKIIIDDTPQLPIATLRSRVRRMKRQYGIGMVIVDYLQLMRGSGKGGGFENRVQEISEISQGLKSIAREMNIPVVALSQLSRAVESRDNKRPMLSDLRESGSIEQDADVVMFLYREDYYFEKTLPPPEERTAEQQEQLNQIKGKAEVIISKNRKGPTGGIALSFQPEFTLFKDYVPADRVDAYNQPAVTSSQPAQPQQAANGGDAPWM